MISKYACHVHSEWSYDAKWSLEELAVFFSKRGYQGALMTEHDKGFSQSKWQEYQQACKAASSSKFLFVPGIEYSEPSNTIHILSWGTLPFFGENQSTLSILEKIKERNGISVFAHPTRKRAWDKFDPNWYSLLTGVEIWNRKSDGISFSKHGLSIHTERGLTPFIGMDFHQINQNFPLSLSFISRRPLQEHSILESVKLGRFESRVFGQHWCAFSSGMLRFPLNRAENIRRYLAGPFRKLKQYRSKF